MSETEYYLIGDIHGHVKKLRNLFNELSDHINPEDIIIFLGDYIDRGPSSFEVIEYLISLSKIYNTVFLRGNHEDMFINYITGRDDGLNYFRNGGEYTIKSYGRNLEKMILPESHIEFFNGLKLFYETGDFIAVHAGLNPDIDDIREQQAYDMIWIREPFYRSGKRWPKTVIFGHTPTPYIQRSDSVFFDDTKNIIGLDTCAMLEQYPLSCMRWPDRKIFRAYS